MLNLILIVLSIFISLLVIVYVCDKLLNKETFFYEEKEYEIRPGRIVINQVIHQYTLPDKKPIHISDTVDDPIENDGDIVTNNTIFIKDKLNINNGNGTVIKNIDIDFIRNLKYLPYHFKDYMCLGTSCIDKYNIKMLKGRLGFSLNTFTTDNPFRFYSEPNFKGWSRGYNTQENKDVTMAPKGKSLGIKSFKNSDKNYMFSAFEKANFGGKRVDYTSDVPDTTGDFKDGFYSMQPRSIKGNILNNSCLSHQNVFHLPGKDNDVIQAVPCDTATDEFYLSPLNIVDKKHDFGIGVTNEHDDTNTLDKDDVHFHSHKSYEDYHFAPVSPRPTLVPS